MADIFISYAREDRAVAAMLAGALARCGWSVWWDRIIPPGKTFDEVIETELASARCAIVLWSKTAILSRWVRDEAQAAINGRKLVPAILDGVEPPMGFRRIQAADLAGWRGADGHSGWQDLKSAVGDLLGEPLHPEAKAAVDQRVELLPSGLKLWLVRIMVIVFAYAFSFLLVVVIFGLCAFVTDAQKPGRESYREISIFVGVAVGAFIGYFASLKLFAKFTSSFITLPEKLRHVILYCLPAAGLFLYLSAVNRDDHNTTMAAISILFCMIAAVAWWQMWRAKVSLRQTE